MLGFKGLSNDDGNENGKRILGLGPVHTNPNILKLHTFNTNRPTVHTKPVGSLSNNVGVGSEKISKKVNLRPFKLYRVYLEPLNSSNVGDFSLSWSLKDFIHVQIKKGKFVVVCPRLP